jgi:hypothetical protein
MNDTPPGLERKFRRLLLSRSGEERLKMGCSMHATARKLAHAALVQKHPGARPAQLKRLLFLHFYAQDFAADERDRIASFLAKRGERNQTAQARFGRTFGPAEAKSSTRVAERPARYGTKRRSNRRKR